MKIQCDVCNSGEASVFCTADEAALCDACDHRVHHANKLASKHHRFSLHLPHSPPLCDICQERRAFLFCQQDRAILCRECDGSIHAVNEHTGKHDRFLLTGVKLSAASAVYSVAGAGDSVQLNSVSSAVEPNPLCAPKLPAAAAASETSSLSEYLIETLPGWRVDEFLDPSSLPFGFSKAALDDGMLPFMDSDFDHNSLGSFPSERSGVWVPQAPAPLHYHGYELKETPKEKETIAAMRGTNRRWSDDLFTVPQISPQSNGSNKRPRALW